MATDTQVKQKIELPDDPDIHRQAAYVEDCRNRLALAEKALAEKIELFQRHCEHDFVEIKQYRPTIFRDLPKFVYIGNRCQKCGLFVPR